MPILERDSLSWASPWLVSQRSPDRGRASEKTKPTRPKDSDSFKLRLAIVQLQESKGNADVTIAQSLQGHSPALYRVAQFSRDERWIAHAHRDDGKRYVVRADEKLTAFVERQRAVYEFARLGLVMAAQEGAPAMKS
jgi:hypothetical protein